MIRTEILLATPAFYNDDVDCIKKILSDDSPITLSKYQKEENILKMINLYLPKHDLGHKILNYLVFDYKISQNMMMHFLDIEVLKRVEVMMLNQNLNNELELNNTKKNNKPKI